MLVSWTLQALFCLYIYGIARGTCEKEETNVWNCVMENKREIQVAAESSCSIFPVWAS